MISLRKSKDLYNLGLLSSSSRILSHDSWVHKSHMRQLFFQAAGALRITIRWHSESLQSEPLEAWHLLQQGIWLPIWQLLKECSLSEFQWFTGITLTPSHKKSYKLYKILSITKVEKCGISCTFTILNCQKCGILMSGFPTHQARKMLILHNTSTEEESNSLCLNKVLRKKQFVAVHRLHQRLKNEAFCYWDEHQQFVSITVPDNWRY